MNTDVTPVPKESYNSSIQNDDFLMRQYEMLQTRILAHGRRMWQLPFSFLGVIGLIISFVFKESNTENSWIFMGLAFIGIILLCAINGAREGYVRTASKMQEIELRLHLIESTGSPRSHYIPYFFLILLGVAICVSAFLGW